MIQLARSELGHYEHGIRVGQLKNIETAHSLQRQVFAKEKERFAALALSVSSAAGWIRSGGVHQTGQRVARKSALWPHWAVLRKNLLILYHSPTEVSFFVFLCALGRFIQNLIRKNCASFGISHGPSTSFYWMERNYDSFPEGTVGKMSNVDLPSLKAKELRDTSSLRIRESFLNGCRRSGKQSMRILLMCP